MGTDKVIIIIRWTLISLVVLILSEIHPIANNITAGAVAFTVLIGTIFWIIPTIWKGKLPEGVSRIDAILIISIIILSGFLFSFFNIIATSGVIVSAGLIILTTIFRYFLWPLITKNIPEPLKDQDLTKQ